MKIGVVTDMPVFLERLQSGLNLDAPGQYQLLPFPDLARAAAALKNNQITLILCDCRYWERHSAYDLTSENIFYLVETAAEEKRDTDPPRICRYHSVPEWKTLFSREGKSHLTWNGSQGQICVFTSGSGGTGCSTAAAAFAVHCAEHGKKPVYLNFEVENSTPFFFQGEALYGMEECLFAMRSGRFSIDSLLASCLITDRSGVRFLQPCRTMQDALTISGEEVMELTDQIAEKNKGPIILDVKLDSSRRLILPVIACTKLIYVADGEEISNWKTQELIHMMPSLCDLPKEQLLQKSCLLYNRFRKGVGTLLEKDGMERLGGIPLQNTADPRKLLEDLPGFDVFSRLREALYV